MFLVIASIQAILLIVLMKSGILTTSRFASTSFRDIWTMWSNDSNTVESDTHLHGFVDLEHKDFSWLKVARNGTDSPMYNTMPTIETRTVMKAFTTTKTTLNTESSWGSVEGVLTPTVNHKPKEIFLFIFVTTTPKAIEKRNFIRNSWGNIHEATTTNTNMTESDSTDVIAKAVYVFFMLGLTGNETRDQAIDEEASEYGDIIRTFEKESYRNIVYKVWFSFDWATHYKPKYIIKVDDDVYLHLPRFFTWITRTKLPKKLYAGYVHYRAYVIRNPRDEHYVSKAEYRGRFYPEYCAGPCYVFSGNLLDKFVKLSKEFRKFRVEDAYLGLIAKNAGVKPFDVGGRAFVWNRSLNRNVKKWRDAQLAIAICLGDSLSLETMKYIHDRYLSLYEDTS